MHDICVGGDLLALIALQSIGSGKSAPMTIQRQAAKLLCLMSRTDSVAFGIRGGV